MKKSFIICFGLFINICIVCMDKKTNAPSTRKLIKINWTNQEKAALRVMRYKQKKYRAKVEEKLETWHLAVEAIEQNKINFCCRYIWYKINNKERVECLRKLRKDISSIKKVIQSEVNNLIQKYKPATKILEKLSILKKKIQYLANEIDNYWEQYQHDVESESGSKSEPVDSINLLEDKGE